MFATDRSVRRLALPAPSIPEEAILVPKEVTYAGQGGGYRDRRRSIGARRSTGMVTAPELRNTVEWGSFRRSTCGQKLNHKSLIVIVAVLLQRLRFAAIFDEPCVLIKT